ncbi:hypothetical protein [Staphylococcus shinii]|uniref:hypothetical protein n=1 Tax=Staphylococcus shinii TaxID=2912228 RepID=UPI003D809FBE
MGLENEINKHTIHKLEQERDMYKRNWDKALKQHDTLIDDIAVLKANISRLERKNEKQLELLTKFSGFINFKLWVSPANDTYKYFRCELDKLGGVMV